MTTPSFGESCADSYTQLYPPQKIPAHDHLEYITQDAADALYALIGHTHQASIPVHNHDDRYYTEAESNARYVQPSRSVSATAGLTGGGDLSANRTISMITPRSVGPSTGNESGIGINGHTHAVDAVSDGYNGNAILKTGANGEVRVKTITGTDAAFANRVSAAFLSAPSGSNLRIEALSGRDIVLSAAMVHSDDYVSGDLGSGFSFLDDTDGKSLLEIDKVKIRHSIVAPGGLTARQIQVLTGDTWVTAGGTVTSVSGVSSPYTITTQAPHGLQVDDLILATRFAANPVNNVASYLEVITIVGDSQFIAQDAPGNSTPPAQGYDYARVGNKTNAARRGSVYLATDDTGAPFIDVIHPVASWADFYSGAKTKVRVGHLSGISGRQPNEYGIYAAIPDATAPKRLVVSTAEQAMDNIPVRMFAYVDASNPSVKVVQVDTLDGLALLGEAVGSPTARSVSWLSRDWGTVLGELYYDQALSGIRSTVALFVGADKVWNAGNDGPGTGLDADTLDGYHASSFVIPSDAELLTRIKNVDGAGSGLDSDLLDGQHAAYFLPAHLYTASDVLAKLLAVDGSGSGLDADLLDGKQGAYYAAVDDLLLYVRVDGSTPITGTQTIYGNLTLGASNQIGFGEFYGGIRLRAATGGWARGVNFYVNGESASSLGAMGAYGAANVLQHFYMGTAYNDTWLKVEATKTTVTGQVVATTGLVGSGGNGQVLNIAGTTHAYAGFYPEGSSGARRAYFGFSSAGAHTMALYNEYTDGTFGVNVGGVSQANFTPTGARIGHTGYAATLDLYGNPAGIRVKSATEPGEFGTAGWTAPRTLSFLREASEQVYLGMCASQNTLHMMSRDFGVDDGQGIGNFFIIGRNSNTSNKGAGHLMIENLNGLFYDLWFDSSGVLRWTLNAHVMDNDGGAVGAQTSSERYKTALPSARETLEQKIEKATNALRAVVQHVQPFSYNSGAFADSDFDGLILKEGATETHRYGMDRGNGVTEGKSLNAITLFGDIIKAFEGVFRRLDALEAASR